MKHKILSFKNRYASSGVIQEMSFELMFKGFKNKVIRTKETVDEYQKGDREFKLKAKDKGGFIAGTSVDNMRGATSILTRNMITLDMDYCPPNILEIIKKKQDEEKVLDFRFFVYSTHSHTAEEPRLRVVVPLTEEITVEKYEPVGRIIANLIGLEYFDATTFQANRIMYFPSVSIDGDYVCEMFGDEEWYDLNPDDALDRYMDYLNIAEFQKPHYIEGLKTSKIEDGKTKDSTKTKYRIVNAFNIEYSIRDAIDTFLGDVYEQGKNQDRYTFLGGESKEGLVILNQQYAFSHHATDPAQGRLLHAFDIVRIHMFGKTDSVDSEQKVYEHYDKATSFSQMVDYIRGNLPEVMKHMPEIKNLIKNAEEFKSGEVEVEEHSVEEGDWKLTLDYTVSGDRHPKSNARNLQIIFTNDEYFKDLFYFDSLRTEICFDRTPPWNKEKQKGDLVNDEDDSEIRIYLNSVYQIAGKDLIYDSVVHQASKRRRHPIKTFFAQLPDWDGVPRIETIICDLYDIEYTQFYREASKSWWVGLVQRVMIPGSKYDMMLIISGQQGVGKSQFGKSIATLHWNGKMDKIDSQQNYFGDDELPFDKKDAYEQLNGIMVYELPEFEKYYKRSDTSTIKSFLSKTTDKFRKSYGRRVSEFKRQCVFIATTNDRTPLRDKTGNRRFLPFYSNLPRNHSRLYNEKYWTEEIRNQCFAEALHYFEEGFNPMASFSKVALNEWEKLNEKATTENDSAPIVEMYVNNKFPKNFFASSLAEMNTQWSEHVERDYTGAIIGREHRNEFSIKEIYTIAFGHALGKRPDFYVREDIENALIDLGFEKSPHRRSHGIFGQQNVYVRTVPLELGDGEELPF